jgi:hypothetical protein
MHRAADYNHLHVAIESRQCDIPEDERSRLQPELERLSQAVDEFPAAELRLTVVYHPKSAVYHAQAKLKLPGGAIVTGHASQWLDDALLRTIAKTVHRVGTYDKRPGEQGVREAKRRVALASGAPAPVEPDAGAVGAAFQRQDYAAFRRALAGLEAAVRDDVGRWVQRYPEVQVLIGQSFSTDDLVEEVFLTALERYGERPDEVPIYEWLRKQIDPAVKALWHEPDERQGVSFAQSLEAPPRG